MVHSTRNGPPSNSHKKLNKLENKFPLNGLRYLGVDGCGNALEQEKVKAIKILENAVEPHT